MKIGRKYFEIEEGVEVGDVGVVGGVGGAAVGEASAETGGEGVGEASADGGTEDVASTDGSEERGDIEPLADAVVNEVKASKRGRKAKGTEQ